MDELETDITEQINKKMVLLWNKAKETFQVKKAEESSDDDDSEAQEAESLQEGMASVAAEMHTALFVTRRVQCFG